MSDGKSHDQDAQSGGPDQSSTERPQPTKQIPLFLPPERDADGRLVPDKVDAVDGREVRRYKIGLNPALLNASAICIDGKWYPNRNRPSGVDDCQERPSPQRNSKRDFDLRLAKGVARRIRSKMSRRPDSRQCEHDRSVAPESATRDGEAIADYGEDVLD